jgi:hypothetical protein
VASSVFKSSGRLLITVLGRPQELERRRDLEAGQPIATMGLWSRRVKGVPPSPASMGRRSGERPVSTLPVIASILYTGRGHSRVARAKPDPLDDEWLGK